MHYFFTVFVSCLIIGFYNPAVASGIGQSGLQHVKQCIMQNDTALCNAIITDNSKDLLARFMSYKLMPCMPSNFTYVGEKAANGYVIVKAQMPASADTVYSVRLAFAQRSGDVKLDIPESLRIGLGEKWENKIQMAEQLYLLLQTNAGGNLACDQLAGLVKK